MYRGCGEEQRREERDLIVPEDLLGYLEYEEHGERAYQCADEVRPGHGRKERQEGGEYSMESGGIAVRLESNEREGIE